MTGEASGTPIDPDIVQQGATAPGPRPVHLRWRYLGLVALGGVIGASLREAAALLIPSAAGIPFATLTVNVVGAFLLGFLLQFLVLNGDDSGGRRATRLLLGTGVLGAFTTYSSLSVDTITLLDHSPLLGIGYALVTVVVGALASAAGFAAASGIHSRRSGAGR